MSTQTRAETFLDLSRFPELEQLRAKVGSIQQELESNTFWVPWEGDEQDPGGHCAFLNGEWTVSPVYFGLWRPGDLRQIESDDDTALLDGLPRAFPRITAALRAIPYVNYGAFARLHPRSRLAAHTHQNPSCVTYHLGLQIPAGGTCGLHVGDDQHIWQQPGEAILFDDNLPHGAWNDSDDERVILHLSIRRDRVGAAGGQN